MINDVLLLRTVDDRSTTPLTTRSLTPMQTLSLDQVIKDVKLIVAGALIIIAWEMLMMTKAMTAMMMPLVITMAKVAVDCRRPRETMPTVISTTTHHKVMSTIDFANWEHNFNLV